MNIFSIVSRNLISLFTFLNNHPGQQGPERRSRRDSSSDDEGWPSIRCVVIINIDQIYQIRPVENYQKILIKFIKPGGKSLSRRSIKVNWWNFVIVYIHNVGRSKSMDGRRRNRSKSPGSLSMRWVNEKSKIQKFYNLFKVDKNTLSCLQIEQELGRFDWRGKTDKKWGEGAHAGEN